MPSGFWLTKRCVLRTLSDRWFLSTPVCTRGIYCTVSPRTWLGPMIEVHSAWNHVDRRPGSVASFGLRAENPGWVFASSVFRARFCFERNLSLCWIFIFDFSFLCFLTKKICRKDGRKRISFFYNVLFFFFFPSWRFEPYFHLRIFFPYYILIGKNLPLVSSY